MLDRRELLATFAVTSTADSGAGTLRQAILDANQAGGTNSIDFAITGTSKTIQPRSPLPTITTPVIIDGTSEPGYSDAPLIILDGQSAGSGATGLLITAGNCTVRGLVINNFDGTGLELENSGNNLVEGNYIGTDVTGTQSQPNGAVSEWDPGLLIDDSANNTIGGTSAGAGNLISGNDADGLDIEGSGNGNLVEGNKIGTDVTGTTALANAFDGLWIGLGAGGDTIGGAATGAGNVIAGNAGNGLENDTTDGGGQGPGNLIEGNFIGTNATGTAALGNDIGVNIECTGNDTIGGTTAGAGNIISGNTSDGIWFYGTNCTHNLVEGNIIGSDPTGTVSLPNGGSAGILFTDYGDTDSVYASQNTVGGTVAGAGNLIAFNAGDGVDVQGGQGNCILGNSFHANSGLGIDLQQTPSPYTNGVLTPSDPNQGINVPVFSSAVWNGSSLTVSGYIGQPNTPGAGFAADQVEVYVLDGTRAGAQSEGLTLVGTLTTNGHGAFSGTITASGLSANIAVTATATDPPGDTSQFAPGVVVTNSGGLTATSTVLQASPAPSTYGQTVTLTATVNSLLGILLGATGTMAFYDGTTLLGTSTVSGGTATLTVSSLSVGTHEITARYGGNTLDASSSSSLLAQVVDPAPLTITAHSATVNYGQSLPTFSATFSGLVAGDTPANLSPSYSVQFSTSAAADSPGGAYAITPYGFSDPNYTTTYVAGTLTIAPVPLTVRVVSNSTVYGQPDPLFTVQFSGLVNGDVPTDFPGLVLTSPATPTSPVGTYTVTASGIVTTSYTITYISGMLTITPASLTVTTANTSKVYGQANPTFSAVFTGLANGDTPAVLGTVSFSTSATASSPVASYGVTPSGLSDPNYTISYAPGTLSITPAPVTVSAESASKTYGQPNPTFTAVFSGLVNGDTPSSLGTLNVTTTATTSSSVGNYPISLTGLADSNYAIAYVPATLTVTPAPLTVAVNNATSIYGQPTPTFTAVITGLVNGDTTADLGTVAFDTPATAASSVGSYPISASELDDANYLITYIPATLTITQAPLTVAAENATRTYGQANPAFTATFFGLVNDDSPSSLGTLTFSTAATQASTIGTYALSASGLNDANYSISYLSATLTVTPAPLTVAADNTTRTYGQPNPTFTATFSGLANGDTPTDLGNLAYSTTANQSSGVGAYPISVSGIVDSNYTITYIPATLTVTSAPITVSASNATRTYGQPNPAFNADYAGLVSGDTPAVLGTPTFNTTAGQTSGVGAYPISVSGLIDANYSISYLPATLTVTPAPLTVSANDATWTYGQPNPTFSAAFAGLVNGDSPADLGALSFNTTATSNSGVGNYSVLPAGLTDPNYDITYEPASLAITPAPLAVTAEDVSRLYGQGNPAFTAVITGLVNGDTSASVGALVFDTDANAGSPAGAYTITPSGLADPNYSVTYQDGTLTVLPAPLTVTAQDATRPFGQPNPQFQSTVTGLVNGDTLAELGTLSFQTIANASSAVGSYPVTPYGLNTNNYIITYISGLLNVTNAAAIAASASAFTANYGQHVELSALVTNDLGPADSPTGAVSFFDGSILLGSVPLSNGTASLDTSDFFLGNNAITAAYSGDSANSAASSVPVTVTLSPAPLIVQVTSTSRPYGAPSPSFAATYSGLVDDDSPGALGSLTFNTEANTSSAAGTYSVSASGLNDPNYAITYLPGTLTITPAALTVTVNDATRPYGEPNPAFSATYSGLVNDDNPGSLGALVIDTTAGAGSSVGVYTLSASGLTDPNYTVIYRAGTLSVTPAPLTVTASDATRLYGQPNPSLGATFEGLVNGDTPAELGPLGFDTPAQPSSDVGRYPVTPYGLSDPNYTITYNAGVLTIDPAPLTVSANDATKVAGAVNPPFSATIAGLTAGDTAADLGTLSFLIAGDSFSTAGSYAVTPSGLSDPNYVIDFEPGTLTVLPRVLNLTASTITALEGSPFQGVVARFTDNLPVLPDGYTAEITWGDGQVTSGIVGYDLADQCFFISGTHTYASAGVYSLEVQVECGTVGADATGTATVAGSALNVSPVNVPATVGVPFTGVIATFNDGPSAVGPSAYSATVYWGDGQSSAGTIGQGPAGVLTVTGSNTYDAEGIYAVHVVVTARDGGEGQASGLATVLASPVTIEGVPVRAVATVPFNGIVARFDVASNSDSASDFNASIDWGDGVTSAGTVTQTGPGQFLVAGSHAYSVAGSLHAQVVVTSALTLRAEGDVPATIVPEPSIGPAPVPVESDTPSSTLSLGSVTSATTTAVTTGRSATGPAPIAVALIVGNNALGGGPMTVSDGTISAASPSAGPPRAITVEHPETGPSEENSGPVTPAVQAAVSSAVASVAPPAAAVAGSAGPIDIRVTLPDAPAPLQASLAPPEQLWQALDRLEEQVATEEPLAELANVVGVGTVAYVGYVLLHTRGGYVLLSLLSSHPLWGEMDPLAVLLDWEKEDKQPRKAPREGDDEDESLQSIIERNNARDEDDAGHVAHQPRSVQHYHQHLIRRERARGAPRPRNQRAQSPKDAL